MKSEKLITGIAVGALVALILMPKTRKMLSEAMCNLTDSLKNNISKAKTMVSQDERNNNS